jgi:hypothetical protein
MLLLQLATVGAGVNVVKVVERHPALLLITQLCCTSPPCNEPSPLPPPPLALFGMQLATVGAGVDVVKVVERQPALLLVDEASPLSDWSQLDQEELQQQIQVRLCVPVTSPWTA